MTRDRVYGAYGLALPQILQRDELTPAPAGWHEWTFSWSDTRFPGPWSWTADHAVFPLQPDGCAVIDRQARHTALHNVPRTEAALLHPYLGSTALAVNTWRGWLGLHAGVVLRHGRAWALMGDRGAGKSSALWWWSQHAGAVMADDLLFTDGSRVLTGPRFLDLRESAAERFGVGTDIGVVGTRRRWRVRLERIDAEYPLAGFIELRWADATTVRHIPDRERLDMLVRHRGIRFATGGDDLSTLKTFALPAVTFARPQAWEHMHSSMELLLAHVDGTDRPG